MKKNRKWIFIVGCILCLYLLAPQLGKLIERTVGKYISRSVPSDYSGLFRCEIEKDIQFDVSYSTKGRCPISMFEYKKYYWLFVYKIPFPNTNSLEDLIKLNRALGANESDYSLKRNAWTIPTPNFKLRYFNDTIISKTNLCLTFDADVLDYVLKNDSLICYTMMLNKFAMKYTESGQQDIYIENKTGHPKSRFNILFLKGTNYFEKY